MKKTLLVITDGIGHSERQEYNAFYHAKTPTYDWLFQNTPHALIRTFGESVGLPEGQMGNSEVGHTTLGLGRVLYQDLLKLSQGLQNKTLFQSQVFQTLSQRNKIHIIILLSDGGVHSHISHLIETLHELNHQEVALHLIGDGRDVSPQSIQTYLDLLTPYLNQRIQIATLSGRYYAMDRDRRWERTKLAYDAIISAYPTTSLSPQDYISQSYQNGIFDEFLEPVAFQGYSGVLEGEGILFLNFRSDRMRQLTKAIASQEFPHFEHLAFKNLYCLCANLYDENFPLPSLLTKEIPSQSLASILSAHHLRQAHIAETEKYAHVTFFFNGGIEAAYEGEERFLIPSPKVATYDLCPEMSAHEVGDQTLQCMRDGFDFIVVNFANGDMVGHTGVFEAGIKAVEAVDYELGRLLKLAQELDYALILVSDHGNCEEMKDPDGNTLTNHTVGDVWCFVFNSGVLSIKEGTLANIAPSILKLMNLPIPECMHDPLF
ncbi:2,3-bisphosphoglycerate-independent phosphoglycerate mutase [Helicobacter pametensis]|uniref:2,3-bisphosphoglycerate-independent phosphoglycerate mutase n=1 Tax=Helicobacter pametensis TaxID=95149 RepID=UPI00047F5A2D|nr:2,3-bisphosphoglycerate-independent phosphoglycerate mutase [Helicobacter pametensis]